MRNTSVAPKWALLKVDDTESWRGPIRERVRRIFSVYLFNRMERTYCCEATPSTGLRFLRSEYDADDDMDDDEREKLADAIQEADLDTEPYTYIHERYVEAAPVITGGLPDGKMAVIHLPRMDGEDEDTAAEWANGNWI